MDQLSCFEHGRSRDKASIRARLRVIVRRTLRKYGYPPDMQKKATETVIQQAELIGKEWA